MMLVILTFLGNIFEVCFFSEENMFVFLIPKQFGQGVLNHVQFATSYVKVAICFRVSIS